MHNWTQLIHLILRRGSWKGKRKVNHRTGQLSLLHIVTNYKIKIAK